MLRFIITLLSYNSLMVTSGFGQAINLDSCGLDQRSILNAYEVAYVDQVVFEPTKLKKGNEVDHTNGFDFNSKNLAFYSCYREEGADGFLTKDKFFAFFKPDGLSGPQSLLQLDEAQKKESGGFDAFIVINCKEYSRHHLLELLKKRRATNNLLPGQE